MKTESYGTSSGDSNSKQLRFDAINPDSVTWSLSSINSRDGEDSTVYENPESDPSVYNSVNYYFNIANSYENEVQAATLSSDAVVLSGVTIGDVTANGVAGSYLKNVIIDYGTPVLEKWSGSLSVVSDSDGNYLNDDSEWTINLIIDDEVGLDTEVWTISLGDTVVSKSSRLNATTAPYDAIIEVENDNVYVSITQNSDSTYLVSITIDTEDLDLELSTLNDYASISYTDLRFSLWDLAGNELTSTLSESTNQVLCKIELDYSKILSALSQIELCYVDTYPETMILESNTVGYTTLVGSMDSLETLRSLGFYVKVFLAEGSLGKVSGVISYSSNTFSQKIGEIRDCGSVIASAYLDFGTTLVIESLGISIDLTLPSDWLVAIRRLTFNTATLSEFTIEDSENYRKIDLSPFIPEALDASNVSDLLRTWEDFLNLMYTPQGKSTRIGVLEKIERISENSNTESCEAGALSTLFDRTYYDDVLNITYGDISEIAEKLYSSDFECTLDEYKSRVLRRFIDLAPYMKNYIGNNKIFKIVGSLFGFLVYINQIWVDKSSNTYVEYDEDLEEELSIDLNSENSIPDSTALSSHYSISIVNEACSVSNVAKITEAISDLFSKLSCVHRVLESTNALNVLSSYGDNDLKVNYSVIPRENGYMAPEAILGIYKLSTVSMTNLNSSGTLSGYRLNIPIYPYEVLSTKDPSETIDYPISDNLNYFFDRFMLYSSDEGATTSLERYIYLTLVTQSSDGSSYDKLYNLAIDSIQKIRSSRNQITITMLPSSTNLLAMDVINRYKSVRDGYYLAIAFKFYRNEKKWIKSYKYEDWSNEEVI